MSWCRSLGSSGDSQARILDRSSAAVKLFDTLTVTGLKEFMLLLECWYCDISCSRSLARILRVMDDGVAAGIF